MRPTLLIAALVITGFGVGGYFAGDSVRADNEDAAQEARASARQAVMIRLERKACDKARRSGYRAGLRIGRTMGRIEGKSKGLYRGTIAAHRRAAAAAAAEPEPPVTIPGTCPPTHQGCTFSHSESVPGGTRCVYSCGVSPGFGLP